MERLLSEGVPEQESEAEADDDSEDDGVSALAQVDLLDQAVDHGKPGRERESNYFGDNVQSGGKVVTLAFFKSV